MKTTNELLPCPFCGSPALLEECGDHHGDFYNLGCVDKKCFVHRVLYTESPDEMPIGEAIAPWNHRAALPAPPVELSDDTGRKLLDKYVSEGHSSDHACGFVDGVRALHRAIKEAKGSV